MLKRKEDSTTTEGETTHFERYVKVMRLLRSMSMDEKAFDSERAKLASLIGEGINLSYTLITNEQAKNDKMRRELERLLKENDRLRKAIRELVNKEPDVDLSVFEGD